MYELLQQCRSKLAIEASQPTVHLRILVGHANMIDILLEGVEVAEAYEAWLDGREVRRRSTTARKHKHAKPLVRSCNDDLGAKDGNNPFKRQGVGDRHDDFSVSCREVEPDD